MIAYVGMVVFVGITVLVGMVAFVGDTVFVGVAVPLGFTTGLSVTVELGVGCASISPSFSTFNVHALIASMAVVIGNQRYRLSGFMVVSFICKAIKELLFLIL